MLWMNADIAPVMGKLEYSGLVGVLIAAVAVLWRALWKKDEQLQTLSKELITHTQALNQIPEALDRLRTEVLSKLDRYPSGKF